ncbi:MAG TPA: AmpG family muropeptide MFS transporter [Rhodocyclaceae bacterium]|nr:AmpG family muropeptide MFS transporter [Rhodocyclaceae bacterium]HMZ82800.1 AmpG family muropeptide MFS transporter [Rhodocyclaceae bacterium]HNA02465.1 AmpG family muropeptide MFS transporter [Rhodocyclaceae bacterium]HNB79854.1 AmpG family muropeptide MFS transporter [Rhodocyclaceae bacterium]HNC60922.1 AmpG family muropeptide MFS transporter [Rhodocyclaceae bacterium]
MSRVPPPAAAAKRESIWQALANRRMLICVFVGFSSGLPLYLLLNLLPAWLKTEGISLKAIGLFALIQFPYTWKFLWSPLLDRYALPLLGRRRGWMLLTQTLLLGVIAWLGQLSPSQDLSWVVYGAAAVAFVSATQDIVLDAYRREILREEELGLGNAVYVNAYRIAGLVPGSLSLILADHVPWSQVFAITALFMLPGMAMTLLVSEPQSVIAAPKTLREAVVEPFREFLNRAGWRMAALVLAFIFFYKLGDSMCTALATPFYLEMGYAKSDIGIIAKNAGLWPAVIGALLGGIWMVKLGINRALWLFGVVQLVSIFGFAWLAWQGPAPVDAQRLAVLAVVIGFEALGVGLGTAAFVAFIARSTNQAYTATQFALFTSLAAVPRTFANAATGWLVETMGWLNFFWLCAALAVPGMLLLFKVAPWGADMVETRQNTLP